MTEATILSDLSIPTSGCGDILIQFDGLQLKAQYEIRVDGEDRVGQIEFAGVVAYRFRAERLMPDYVSGSFDALVRIDNSLWVSEMIRDRSARRAVRHFAVFFSSNGYLEVLADAATTVPTGGTFA